MPRCSDDRRAQRTRRALVGAFNGLLFERGYLGIRVEDVADRARVGRSTFYEHFRGKEALLSSSVKAARKCKVRADWRPPSRSTQPVMTLCVNSSCAHGTNQMETITSDLRTTTPAAQRPRNVRRRDVDPVRIFVDKDRLARFWFLAAVVVLIGAAIVLEISQSASAARPIRFCSP